MSNRILDYPEATAITSDDYILLDNAGTGAKCIKASALNINMDNYTIKEARGAIASFDDGEDLPLAFMGAYITAIQDLHGYDSPWVGGAGKNLFDKPNLVMNKAIPAGTTIYGQIFGVTASFKLYGYDEENTEYEVMSLSINKNSTTTTRAYVRLEISQSALNALGNGNLMVSLSDFTRFEPYSNECPISGWSRVDVTRCGIQQWDEEWESGKYSLDNGSKVPDASTIRSKNYINVKANTAIYSKMSSLSSSGAIAFWYDKDKTFISWEYCGNKTLTVPSNAYYMTFYCGSSYGTTYNNDMSINYPSTDTDYHAYNGNTYTIDLDGTRYGCTLDVVNGVLTLTHEIADLPSLGWSKSTSTANIYFYVLYTSGANGTYNEPATNVMSDIYIPKSRNAVTNNQGTVGVSAEANALYIADGRFDNYTVTQFKEAMSDVQLLLPLATPTTIQLTPTMIYSLIGENNIFASTGDSIVDYRKLWVKPEM